MTPDIELLLTVDEVAALLRKSRQFVYREIHQARLPAKRYGRSFGIRPTDLAEYTAPDEARSHSPRNPRERIKHLMRTA